MRQQEPNQPGPTKKADPTMKFRFFKRLLASNNLILEEMAGLERLVYEGRPFTREDSLQTIQSLIEQGCSLVEDLNALTGGQHHVLFRSLQDLARDALQAILRERTFDGQDLVLPLDAISLENLDEVGGKAANLGELRNRVGLPTPLGFAVTASAAALFLGHTGLLETFRHQLAGIDITDIGALERICAKASEKIMIAPLPPDLDKALQEQARGMVSRFGPDVRLAVRSSAVCEDSDASFAGQHATVLGATPFALPRAWSAVVASAFTARAVFYRRSKGYSEQDVMMSVLVLNMVQAKASGVLYTIDPNSAHSDDVLLSAAWGLGVSVVDGSSHVDFWRIRRSDRTAITAETGDKASAFTILPQGGIVSRPVPDEDRKRSCLSDDQVRTLVEYGLRLEAHYGMPQDVEWSLDHEDRLFVLQSRPLMRAEGTDRAECCEFVPGRTPLLCGGQPAALGMASGMVYSVQSDHALDDIPKGAILVARQTSPAYVAAMGKVAGIITDIGSTTGHMASVAREFGIPTLVDVGRATHLLAHGTEITLDATNGVVYAGRVQEILSERRPVNLMKGSPVYKALQEALKFIIPLNLVDPLMPNFTPKGCQTLHDIIRFCHEVAMHEMFRLSDELPHAQSAAHELRTGLPFKIFLYDLGDGVVPGDSDITVSEEELLCEPLKALLAGMMHPEVTGAQTAAIPEAASYAVVSKSYVNFSGRLGNHFATVDAYVGPVINDNYITFSFKGGAAEYTYRVRRATLLAGILRRLGFRVSQTGDALKAEIRKYDESRFLDRLTTLGRLLASIRSLDLSLNDDEEVARMVDEFFKGGHSFLRS
ncbi:phosphoenolpyruvate synthase [Desulfomicrobium apsheronum]|uniref:Phosphoenolpyruvate synthase n=1 Tax=Desulfomicrobium apsheronum TaxID=52560 RepID=A0A1I3Q924_9BACT|nr:PEP/pyruvate-binding domain-containing protein [Desulfomicrobium apsheronum]SFJ29606.1 phosphoenolpyruvate synthase [Desulfomicrobium apsheronum]